MGRSKAAKKKGAKELVVGSDIDSEEETTIPQPEDSEEEKEATPVQSDSEDEDKPKKKKEYKGGKNLDKGGKKGKGKGKEEPVKEEPAKKGGKKHVDPSPSGKKKAGDNELEKVDDSDDSEEESESESEEEEEDLEAIHGPVVVLYCPTCTFQAEMCEYSGMFEKCKPWLAEHAKEIAAGEEKGRKRKGVYAEGEGPVPGAKLKKKPDQCVLLNVKKRSGKKVVTLIQGLDFYGINMKELTRDFKKRFATGCGIVSTAGELDAVEVQGDVTEAMCTLLPDKYKIPPQDLWIKDGKDKRRLIPN